MYSGTTLTRYSGRVLGAHQKIDRIARRHLKRIIPQDEIFPGIARILHFEGKNGPDAIKRKSPAKDEPWHYFSPHDAEDVQLVQLIEDHYRHIVDELKKGNKERVAFEAAWLAHAIVDGLTPAHHYPYEEKLVELRGGKGIESRTTIREKLVIPGDTKREMIKNNWKMWGPKGLFTTHGLFEIGIATLIMPMNFKSAVPTRAEVKDALKNGLPKTFIKAAQEVVSYDMYDRYYLKGWTPKLAYDVRNKLGPIIIKTVTLSWVCALVESGLIDISEIST